MKDSKGSTPLAHELTDQEIICTWMEPKPEPPMRLPTEAESQSQWWKRVYNSLDRGWEPYTLTLDALWEVEERLTALEWGEYLLNLPYIKREVVHATPAQKIKALAAVLRPLVTARTLPKQLSRT